MSGSKVKTSDGTGNVTVKFEFDDMIEGIEVSCESVDSAHSYRTILGRWFHRNSRPGNQSRRLWSKSNDKSPWCYPWSSSQSCCTHGSISWSCLRNTRLRPVALCRKIMLTAKYKLDWFWIFISFFFTLEKSISIMRPLFFLPLIFAGSSKPKKDQFIPKCTKGMDQKHNQSLFC